jgi:hypothetical protein
MPPPLCQLRMRRRNARLYCSLDACAVAGAIGTIATAAASTTAQPTGRIFRLVHFDWNFLPVHFE